MAQLPALARAFLRQKTRRSRPFLAALWQALSGSVAALRHTLSLLWLEVTGFFFLVFAALGAWAAVREYKAWQAGLEGPGRLAAVTVFILVFFHFGVSSFRRARRKGRRRH